MHQGYYWLAPGPLSEMTAGKNGIPTAELDIITDMLADMLRRCPDVRAAEMQLASQSALIGVMLMTQPLVLPKAGCRCLY